MRNQAMKWNNKQTHQQPLQIHNIHTHALNAIDSYIVDAMKSATEKGGG